MQVLPRRRGQAARASSERHVRLGSQREAGIITQRRSDPEGHSPDTILRKQESKEAYFVALRRKKDRSANAAS